MSLLLAWPNSFLWGGLTVRDISSSAVGKLGAGGPRFNDVVVECISVRLRVLRVDLTTRCDFGNSLRSPEQGGIPMMILIFQGDVVSLTRDRVFVGFGAGFQIHIDLRDNGFSPLITKNLLFIVTGTVPVICPV